MDADAKPLPEWREHRGHLKVEPLRSAGAAEPVLERFLAEVTAELGRERQEVRVLDIGCGRGALVARLLEEGWDAWGADISSEYVAAGVPYFASRDPHSQRIRQIEESGNLPFGRKFDVIVSTQTIEHVEDLDGFCRGIADVSRPGTKGFHEWPAKWKPIESHMLLPLAHWLPKGKARRGLIRAELAIGLGAPHFLDQPLATRAAVFAKYSETETFYRTTREVRATFANHGIETESTETVASWITGRWPSLPGAAATAMSLLYGQFGSVIMTSSQSPAEPTGQHR